jgi:ferredoxin
MSEEERKAFLEKQKELQDALKNCPVPRIIVQEHNKAAEK